MNELIRALQRFITRDLIYLIGGGSLVVSFLYTFERLPSPNDHGALYLLIAGISYVVGYTVQDSFGLIRVIPTTAPHRLNRYLRFLYRCYVREPWRDIPDATNFERAEEKLADDRQVVWLERITTFQQIGTTVGPCWFASALLLGTRWCLKGGGRFELAVVIGAFLMALILVHLAWIKAAQQAQYLSRHNH